MWDKREIKDNSKALEQERNLRIKKYVKTTTTYPH